MEDRISHCIQDRIDVSKQYSANDWFTRLRMDDKLLLPTLPFCSPDYWQHMYHSSSTHFSDVVTWHIEHEYTTEMSQKCEVVCGIANLLLMIMCHLGCSS